MVLPTPLRTLEPLADSGVQQLVHFATTCAKLNLVETPPTVRAPRPAWEPCSLSSGEGLEARDRRLGGMRSKPLCGCLLDGAIVRMGVRSHATGRIRAGESETARCESCW